MFSLMVVKADKMRVRFKNREILRILEGICKVFDIKFLKKIIQVKTFVRF